MHSLNDHFVKFAFSSEGTGAADDTYHLIPGRIEGHSFVQALLENAAPSPAGTTPTSDVLLQATLDPDVAYDDTSTKWHTILTFTQTNTGATNEYKQAILTASVSFGIRWRIKHSVGSAAGTPVYGHTIFLNFLKQ
jgi:hypothetical protein